ncbi:uncharacterized protein TRAVEDRAFT_53149 [Trametes versicolor FP-101664 SS1]|uniref:uncharacterized protein n=1 Tax=Trametes versicolor (strain FP-101664) TaxID=717944 RepID=UPI000462286A|nr:uncharacterized protein TRAVEDRAFT_53149 [Trametes versicolor FP-101664 SS1]EIW52709.1 hypothetical protein TRAVEDRAFT_53149 [Trametes versicolor FP-101664 SS1]
MLALAPHVARAGLTAFSGDTCNGPVGEDVACDGSCIPFEGRHSFLVDGGSGNHCVSLFVNGSCSGQVFTFQNQNGACQNVNTGTDIQSFLCAPSNQCLSPLTCGGAFVPTD